MVVVAAREIEREGEREKDGRSIAKRDGGGYV